MLVMHEREKLIQAISFFATHTRQCGKVKLFKLLYFLDFEHFKIAGRSVTGQDYSAWKMGPVPVALYEEIDAPHADMADALDFDQKPIRGGEQMMLEIKPKAAFSDRHFTRREMALMQSLAREYRDARSEDMVEATHLENMPWDKIYNQKGLRQHKIPYELALRADEAESMTRVASDRRELVDRFG